MFTFLQRSYSHALGQQLQQQLANGFKERPGKHTGLSKPHRVSLESTHHSLPAQRGTDARAEGGCRNRETPLHVESHIRQDRIQRL